MRHTLLALLLWPSLAAAAVLNVEFKFTPFTGDLEQDQVESVPGTARVSLNGVLYAEQPVQKQNLPVMFDEREVASAVWIPVESMGSAVRKGKNTIRIEFVPSDAKAPYRAQLSWATVTDQVREEGTRTTNQADEGVENKAATGTVTFERAFTADFAKDQPWHHYPAVTALTDADKQQLAKLVADRAGWFAPPYDAIYKALDGQERVKTDEVRKAKCLDAAHAAGVKFPAPTAADLDFVTAGGPEVVIRRKNGAPLYVPDRAAFEKIKGDEKQMCAGMALMTVYPPRLVVVKTPEGVWQAVS